MLFLNFKVLVQVIEHSDGCIHYPSAGPIRKLHCVKQTLNLFNENFVSCSKVFPINEVKSNWRVITKLLWKSDF